MCRRLQVLLPHASEGPLVAGLPCALRTAQRAAEELSPSRVLFCGEDPAFEKRWSAQLRSLSVPVFFLNGQPAVPALSPEDPLLVVSPEGFPAASALKDFLERAAGSGRAARWVSEGRTVAAYHPLARAVAADGEPGSRVVWKALSADAPAEARGGWLDASGTCAARSAEESLCAGLAKDNDGYLARFDRKLSVSLSLLLLKTPVTPNHITTASLSLGLLGALGVASGSYPWQVAGALVLWFCCILDGCDGEVARLKLLTSRWGAAYDVAADHLAHLAIFVAIPVGIHRADPGAAILLPGVLLVSGFLAAMFSVWWLVLRVPEEKRGPLSLVIERLASRDYVYVVAALAVIGRLEWFLWAAGVGSHLFWLALWGLSLRRPTS